VHRRAPCLHHRAPVGLLVVRRAHHVHLALEAEQGAREGQRGAPLPGARLGHQPLDAGPGVLVGLRDRRVGLVRAGGRDALVLEVDVGRRVERLLQAPRAPQRRRAPQLVRLADLFGDLDLRLHRDLLRDDPHGEDRRQVLRAGRQAGARAQRRKRVPRQIWAEIHPVRRDAVLGQQELRALVGHAAILDRDGASPSCWASWRRTRSAGLRAGERAAQ
jgi:hypothetical protein